jgi:hypothetical protein
MKLVECARNPHTHLRFLIDEFLHQIDTLPVIQDYHFNTPALQEPFFTLEVDILPDDNTGYLVQEYRSGAHAAWTDLAVSF